METEKHPIAHLIVPMLCWLLSVLCCVTAVAQKENTEAFRTFRGHSNWVNSIVFSPDGHYVLSGSDDNTLKLWKVSTGEVVRTFTGHSGRVKSVAFSPDGRFALSGSKDHTLKLWKISTGKVVRTFKGHSDAVKSVVFSPNGRHVLSWSWDKTVKLWNLSSGEVVRTFTGHSNAIISIAFSPDGRYVLSGNRDKTVKLWNISSGELIRAFTGHSNWVNSVAFSPDGHYVLSGSSDATLKLWKISSGELVRTFTGYSSWVKSVSFSPDGRFALSGTTDGILKLWEISSGELVRTFTGHSDEVISVAFSPDGRFALSGSEDNTVKLWKIAPPSRLALITQEVNTQMKIWLEQQEREMEQWQKKGEYESNSAYNRRMRGRSAKLLTLKQASEAQQELLTKKVKQEYLDKHDQNIDWKKVKISQYDAENETFSLTVAGLDPMVVYVPRAEARKFKKQALYEKLLFEERQYLLSKEEFVLISASIGNDGVGYYPWEINNLSIYESQAQAQSIVFDPINIRVGDVELQTSNLPTRERRYDLTINIPQGEATDRRYDIAVVIGNKNYRHSGKNVAFAHQDARTMKKYLIETFGFQPENILYVEDAGKADFEHFFGTVNNPKGKLHDFVVKGQSNVFIFYSGHGAPGLTDQEGYFVPVDARDANNMEIGGYPLSTFYKNISQLQVKDHITVVLDACFSGAGYFKNISPIAVVANNRLTIDSEKILVFSSSRGKEVSSWYNAQQHGMFTFFFLKAIHNKNADNNGDNRLTAAEIQRYVADETQGVPYVARRKNSVEQHPQLLGERVTRTILTFR